MNSNVFVNRDGWSVDHVVYQRSPIDDYDTPLDPLQRERRKMLQKQAFAVQEKLGIRFEDAFTQESIEAKYAP